jgi:hypothetical protein
LLRRGRFALATPMLSSAESEELAIFKTRNNKKVGQEYF